MPNGLDGAIHDWIVDHRSAWLTRLAWRVSDLGSTVVVSIGVVLLGLVLARRARHWWPLAMAVAADLVVEVTARSIKALYWRSRPPYETALEHLDNSSFPSAHVGRAAVLLALAVWALPERWRRAGWVVAAVLVVAVGWSRLYLGSHWFTDTVGGLLLGAAVAAVALTLSERGRPGLRS